MVDVGGDEAAVGVDLGSADGGAAPWLGCDVDGPRGVELLGGETGVAPGQACVLYDSGEADARVLGGGFIERSERWEAEALHRVQLPLVALDEVDCLGVSPETKDRPGDRVQVQAVN